jgi:hypothetical protein
VSAASEGDVAGTERETIAVLREEVDLEARPGHHRRRARRLSAALVGVCLWAAGCSGGAASNSPAPTSTGSSSTASTTSTTPTPTTARPLDFTTVPQPLPGTVHGDLVASEPIDVGLPDVRAWRILYRSETLAGQPVAVSGYVLAPAASGANRSVIAWAHESVGSADSCAPSATVAARLARPADAVQQSVVDQFRAWLALGYVIVATDYQGLGTPGPHPYLVGEVEGRNVLDSIVAVSQLAGAGAGTRALAYGVSQGGQAALWAGQLAATWSPAVQLVGIVSIAPLSEADLLLPLAARTPAAAGYLMLAVEGLAAGNPLLHVDDVLDVDAAARAGVIETDCLATVQARYENFVAETGRPLLRVDLLATPGWREAVLAVKPGTVANPIPRFIGQGVADTTVPAITTRLLVGRMCGRGEPLTYREYPLTGHYDAIAAAAGDVVAYVGARFAGAVPTSSC